MNRTDAKQRDTMNEIPQVTLFFKDVVLHFAGTTEQILAKQYDFTQFGPIIAVEGNDLGPTLGHKGLMAVLKACDNGTVLLEKGT